MSEDRSDDALALDQFPYRFALWTRGLPVPVALRRRAAGRSRIRLKARFRSGVDQTGICYRLVALLVAVDLGCLVTLFKGPSLLIVLDELAALIAIQAHRP